MSDPPPPTAVEITASDHQRLAAKHFPHPSPCGAVLICPATGVRQHFYAPFAAWLTEQGYAALIFDYRGVGDSLFGAHVRRVDATLRHWGELDMPAALAWLAERYSGLPLHLVGHSAGGQLIGLMHNHARLASVVQVASSSGYVRHIRWPDRWTIRVLLSVYIPAAAALLNYVPARRIGWGQDLPAGVARQWANWCLSPGYVANSFGREIVSHFYDELAAPIYSVSATDDVIATPENIEDLLRLFPAAPKQRVRLDPARFGLKRIGHIDLFRPACSVLWPEIVRGF